MESEKQKYTRRSGTDRVMAKTEELTRLIRATDSFQRYQKDLELLKSQEDLYSRLNEFRRKSLYLDEQNERYYEISNVMYEEYKDTLTEPVVREFLASQARINKLLRQVFDRIAADMEIDVSYMES